MSSYLTNEPERKLSFDVANPDKVFNSNTGKWEPLHASITTPDWNNQKVVLQEAGTWTADTDGFIQWLTGVTHPSTVYITFSMTINGKPLEAKERPGLLPTGLYNWVSQPFPVKAGDIVKISQDGGGTGTVINSVAFYPILNS